MLAKTTEWRTKNLVGERFSELTLVEATNRYKQNERIFIMPNKINTVSAACLSFFALASSPALAQSANTISDAISQNGFLMENGLLIPAFDPAKGRELFGSKGCILCHSINGLGGEDAPDISAEHMETPMNAFDFAARMWRGAPAMIAMQEYELDGQIQLNGDELAAIIAFAHDADEQAKFSKADIPANILKKLEAE